MCGRFVLRGVALLRAVFEYTETLRQSNYANFEEFSEHGGSMPRYNIAPSQSIAVVRINSSGQRTIDVADWGLIPQWTKGKPKSKPINARAETVATSGMFRQAFDRRRCLIPADGFYEWKGAKPPKQPYFIHRKDDALFAFAGLWERWKPEPDAEPVETCTIITTTPNELMKPIHDRMPVIVSPADYGRWLDRDLVGSDVSDLLKPADSDAMEARPVSTAVNSTKNDGPALIE